MRRTSHFRAIGSQGALRGRVGGALAIVAILLAGASCGPPEYQQRPSVQVGLEPDFKAVGVRLDLKTQGLLKEKLVLDAVCVRRGETRMCANELIDIHYRLPYHLGGMHYPPDPVMGEPDALTCGFWDVHEEAILLGVGDYITVGFGEGNQLMELQAGDVVEVHLLNDKEPGCPTFDSPYEISVIDRRGRIRTLCETIRNGVCAIKIRGNPNEIK